MKKHINKSITVTFALSLLFSAPAFGMKKLVSKLLPCCFTSDIQETGAQILLDEEELEEPEPLPEPEPEPYIPPPKIKRSFYGIYVHYTPVIEWGEKGICWDKPFIISNEDFNKKNKLYIAQLKKRLKQNSPLQLVNNPKKPFIISLIKKTFYTLCKRQDFTKKIPDEVIIYNILTYLNIADLVNIIDVNKKTNNLVKKYIISINKEDVIDAVTNKIKTKEIKELIGTIKKRINHEKNIHLFFDFQHKPSETFKLCFMKNHYVFKMDSISSEKNLYYKVYKNDLKMVKKKIFDLTKQTLSYKIYYDQKIRGKKSLKKSEYETLERKIKQEAGILYEAIFAK